MNSTLTRHGLFLFAGGLGVAALAWPLKSYSYLLFHMFAELFAVIIAAGTFVLAWNWRRFENRYLVISGIGMGIVGSVDLLHMMAYKGMSVLPFDADANLPTQLWIVSRFLQVVTLAAATLLMDRQVKHGTVLVIFLGVAAALLGLVFTGSFPDCYIEGMGLTPFKIWAEYLIAGALLFGGFVAYRNRSRFSDSDLRWLLSFVVLSVLSGICFMMYSWVDDTFNFLGHVLKTIAFYCFYKSIVESSLVRPVETLFGNLKRKEGEQAKLILDLEAALANVKTLEGLLPICAWCHKIRDDKGYWNQLDQYITRHTSAELSHGICPDCLHESTEKLKKGLE